MYFIIAITPNEGILAHLVAVPVQFWRRGFEDRAVTFFRDYVWRHDAIPGRSALQSKLDPRSFSGSSTTTHERWIHTIRQDPTTLSDEAAMPAYVLHIHKL